MKISIEEDLKTGNVKIRIEADVPRMVIEDDQAWHLAVVEKIAKELDTMVGRKS